MLAKCLSTNFPTAAADLVPCPFVHLIRAVSELPGKTDDLCNDELSDAARIAEWGVENSYSVLSSILRIDLVCPYTETSYYNQILGFFQDSHCESCLGSNADGMDVPNRVSRVFS